MTPTPGADRGSGRDHIRSGRDRAQSGLDRLALFLLGILLLLLVAPTVLGFAGFDVRDADAGEESANEPTLTVVGIEGVAIDENRTSVGAIRVTVTNGGGGKIDPRELSATWVHNGSYDLVAADSDTADSDATADGTFAVRPGEGSDTVVLEGHTDRAVIELDIGTDDVQGAKEVGRRLRAGERATLTLVTPDGASARLVVVPPERLPANGTVAL